MPHIKLPEGLPGIRGPMAFSPETAKALNMLVDALLQRPTSLTPGERELIATYVSYLNDCFYCQTTHGAVAAAHYHGDRSLVQQIKDDYTQANISDKLKALLKIAALVQQSGKKVTIEAVNLAKQQGATDQEIHDTVLIAAAFCMFNRYVDGLDTWSPQDDMEFYFKRGEQVAKEGYFNANKSIMNISE